MKLRLSRLPFRWHLNSIRRSTKVVRIFAALISLAFCSVQAQQAPPDLVLHRTVTYADRQTYIELPFEVPKGIIRVTIESSYTEKDKHTTIDIGLVRCRTISWMERRQQIFLYSLRD